MKETNLEKSESRRGLDELSSQVTAMVRCESVEKVTSSLKPKPEDFEAGNALVLVEVEGGIVQHVSLLNQSAQPVLVLVRDYDNYRDEPEDYQDAEWLLT